MDIGLHMKDMGMSLEYAYKEETPQNLTLQFVEELAEEVPGSNKTIKMFQTMAIVNMKMDNLGLEVKLLKFGLTTMEGGK